MTSHAPLVQELNPTDIFSVHLCIIRQKICVRYHNRLFALQSWNSDVSVALKLGVAISQPLRRSTMKSMSFSFPSESSSKSELQQRQITQLT